MSMHHSSEGGNILAREVMSLMGACLGKMASLA